MIDYKTIKNELIAFEMQAISELYRYWAVIEDPKKPRFNRERLHSFRRQVLTSKYSLNRQIVPHELVYDEYQLAREAVKQARQARKDCRERRRITSQWLKEYEVAYRIEEDGKHIVIKKPFPAPPATLEQLVVNIPKKRQSSMTPADIAREIVGKRFGITASAVVKQCKKPRRHKEKTKTSWRLLATLFLELNAHDALNTQAKVLDCLLLSGYSRFNLYYLVQISHSIKTEICLRKWKPDMIKELCDFVCPGMTKGPFTQMLSDKKNPAIRSRA